MSGSVSGGGTRPGLFTLVKYLTYSLLFINVFLFLQEELGALEHTFTGDITIAQFVQVFAATIDTTAWFVLLLLFELETSILDDEQIVDWTKRSLHGIRLLCGASIIWAFTGYCAELLTLYQVELLRAFDACSSADAWSVLVTIDEYVGLDPGNCATVSGDVYRVGGFEILAAPEVLTKVRILGWTDVINAAAWILVVAVLEVEVRLQLKGKLTNAIVHGTRYVKYVLYATLFGAAAYWGYGGKFLDFWDACLWLFAFIFIELNVFDWQQETQRTDASPAAA